MARWLEAAQSALTLWALFGAFPRFADMGVIEGDAGVISVSPLPLTVVANAPAGTVVGTISVQGGGSPTYTYSLLSDPSGYFTIVGNELRTNTTPLTAGTYPIVILATGSLGDTLQLPVNVIVTPSGYVPTYYFLGF